MSGLNLARGARLRADHARGGFVLLRAEEVTELNGTAHEILSLCDGRSLDDLTAALLARYPQADPHELRADVRDFLTEAHAAGWVHAPGWIQGGAP